MMMLTSCQPTPLFAGMDLRTDAGKIAALLAAWPAAPAQVRRQLRISSHFTPWLERQSRQRSRVKARTKFLADVERGKASFDLVKLPLLPHQREGMLHLAFGERARDAPMHLAVERSCSQVVSGQRVGHGIEGGHRRARESSTLPVNSYRSYS